MKKIAAIASVALFALAFTSCKKDYSCECTSKIDNEVIGTNTISLGKQTKKKAEDACSAKATSGTIGTATATVECKLK